MRKGLKYTFVSLGCLLLAGAIVLGIMYAVSPYKVKRWLGMVSSVPNVFVDRLKGKPYSKSDYDGIDVATNRDMEAFFFRQWRYSMPFCPFGTKNVAKSLGSGEIVRGWTAPHQISSPYDT